MTHPDLHASDVHRSLAFEAGLHLVALAAKALLVIGGAVLLGEVVAGPGRRLLGAKAHPHSPAGSPAEDTVF
jgi:hypothetical protein